jgi:hypothetical protein
MPDQKKEEYEVMPREAAIAGLLAGVIFLILIVVAGFTFFALFPGLPSTPAPVK